MSANPLNNSLDRKHARAFRKQVKYLRELLKSDYPERGKVLEHIAYIVSAAKKLFGADAVDDTLKAIWDEEVAMSSGICVDCLKEPATRDSILCGDCYKRALDAVDELPEDSQQPAFDLQNWLPDDGETKH